MNKFTIILLLLATAVGCHTNDPLELALQKSKTNRKELEKVLAYYSQSPTDSLKLRAARFLIENMPGHYTYSGDFIKAYKQELHAINPSIPASFNNHLYALPLANPHITDILEKEYDIEHITSDFLIHHIDYKFELWSVIPWKEKIPFEDFCEYLLPYRVDIEPLPDIHPNIQKTYIQRLNAFFTSIRHSHVQPGEFKEFIRNKIWNSRNFTSIRIPFSNQIYQFDCTATSYNILEEYRSIGIPTAIDFTPHWASDDNRHVWNSYTDPYQKLATVNYIPDSKMAKIYRRTYSHNPAPLSDGNHIPSIFTPFIKDVTHEYIKTYNLTYAYPTCNNVRNVYLSVFNQQQWQEVAWSTLQDYKAHFENLGVDIIYLPTYYLNDRQIPANYPFYLGTDGKTKELIPDTNRRTTIRMTRKYPKELTKTMWEENLLGATIEASNNPDFIPADTIYTIAERASNSVYHIYVTNNKSYRYFRIKQAPERLKIQLAEWSFTNAKGQEIKGKIITPTENKHKKLSTGYLTQQQELATILHDKDVLSYTTMIGWLGMDFNKPTAIKTIEIILRNDGNDICPSDVYELFYHDKGGWQSLGKQTASNRYIEFENVPIGALYWLRNWSQGKEERIFTYDNNKVTFW